MVLRPSSSSWSVSPETIMSHHYKLTQGIKGVVDTSPPFSMYNSPISIHYVPKRASSADATKRRQPKLPRPHRELAAFIGEVNPSSLRLPLPLKDDVKPKILESRNYQPPLHRNRQWYDVISIPNMWSTVQKRLRQPSDTNNIIPLQVAVKIERIMTDIDIQCLSTQKPKPPPPHPKHNPWTEEARKSGIGQRNRKDNFYFDLFKDAVYSAVIDGEVFTDG
ncbi:hypothetical protein KIN20_034061 [Parelaphostrongylus tenuis]|uniref:Uncharacterized protein n=1 Tax=Parelaphostrongylus tenuis TaxID=148309 RepID=A0AAD5WJR6_PARTN|nr:hypothetical protein KIN20_034061 [Parelaphostrongylus tenuis]